MTHEPDAVSRFGELIYVNGVSAAFRQSGLDEALQQAFAEAHGVPPAPGAKPACVYFVAPPELQQLENFWLRRDKDDAGVMSYMFGYGSPSRGLKGDELLLNAAEEESGVTSTLLMFRVVPEGRAQMGMPDPSMDANGHLPLAIRLKFLQLALRQPSLHQPPALPSVMIPRAN